MNPQLIDSLMGIERQLHKLEARLSALEQRIIAIEQRMPATSPPGTAPIVVRMTGRDAAADEAALSDAMTRRDALEVLTGQRAALIVLEE